MRIDGAAEEAGDERAAGHADERGAGQDAEAGAVRARRNHGARRAVGGGHRGARSRCRSRTDAAHMTQSVARTTPTAVRHRRAAHDAPPAITSAARVVAQQLAAEVVAERAGERHDREQHARHERHARRAPRRPARPTAAAPGPKLRSTNCSPKITHIIRMKFLERQHVAERHAAGLCRVRRRRRADRRGRRTARARAPAPPA
mgnify:CR=1 FL=1